MLAADSLVDGMIADRQRPCEQAALAAFVVVPFTALAVAVPVAWGRGLSWHDVVIGVVMYAVTGHGITVGFHRCFTHRAFRAKRWLRVTLAVAGSMAIEGPVVRWVADHRKHHRYADRDGDPHSPWRYGTSGGALTKGFAWAHVGWLFDVEQTPQERYAADLLADPAIARVSRSFHALVAVSMFAPPLAGGLWGWSWSSAASAFFWGSLVRVALLHHVTFSTNSICHLAGRHPFQTRDRSGNVWWLAIPSMGESWHNGHHADPLSARHGMLKGQVDTSAGIIRILERCGQIDHVRWPEPARTARLRSPTIPTRRRIASSTVGSSVGAIRHNTVDGFRDGSNQRARRRTNPP